MKISVTNQQSMAQLKDMAQERALEYLKCKGNFIHFCSNYIQISLPGGDQLLNPYDPQKELINLVHDDHYVLVLKSRQIGISTIIQAYVAYLCTFYDNAVIGIISKDGRAASTFARKVADMLSKLPSWFDVRFKVRNVRSFILENGCECHSATIAPQKPESTLRSEAITFLVIDEAAFIKYMEEAWTGIVSTLSTNQMQARNSGIPYGTVVLSTPNKTVGTGKWFYQNYLDSKSGHGLFKPYEIHWRDVRELASDPTWYKNQCKLHRNDKKKIDQELEMKFLPASGSFLDEDTAAKLQDVNIQPLNIMKLYNGEVRQYQLPIDRRYYIIGVDTAAEHGDDYSGITIWDYITLEQVWEYQGKCSVPDFIKVVQLACVQYPGSLVIERNSYGDVVLSEMSNSEFSYMIYKEKRGTQLIPGVYTDARTRPLIIDALYSYVTQFTECIKSKQLALELVGLVSKANGRVEADTGSYDDLVMATGMAFYVRKYDPPMMIESDKNTQKDFMHILDMNSPSKTGFGVEMNNSSIMKAAKEMIKEQNEEADGFIDVFSFYTRE